MGSAELNQWVNDSCHSLPDSGGFGNVLEGNARFGDATAFLREMIGLSFFENSWPDSSQMQDELRPYLQKVLGIVLPSLVVAGLLLLCASPVKLRYWHQLAHTGPCTARRAPLLTLGCLLGPMGGALTI